jgi:hypothetical protein
MPMPIIVRLRRRTIFSTTGLTPSKRACANECRGFIEAMLEAELDAVLGLRRRPHIGGKLEPAP